MALLKPIPLWFDLPGGPSAIKPYGINIGYDFNHPKSQEKLVDLSDLGLLTKSWYAVTDGSNPPYNRRIVGAIDQVFVRETVSKMCAEADNIVKSIGLRLLFVDGYRSIETQSGLYNHFETIIRKRSPHLTNEQLRKETLVYVTSGELDVADPETWFVHATGGSIDVLLFDETKKEILNCGVGFDDDTPLVFTDHYERTAPESEPSKNRRIIYNAMTEAGFTNYPYEYFHYDFGTIIYSVRKKIADPAYSTKAFYGLAQLKPK